MKTKFFILISIITLSFTSCKKDSSTTKDLTTNVVGVFKGNLNVTGIGAISDVQIRISKVDDETIFIQSFAGTEASSFTAKLSDDPDGVVFTISEQAVEGGTIRGNIGIVPGEPDLNGFYETATKAIAYGLKVNIDGSDFDEIFIGVKQ